MRRYAARVDANQAAVVADLRKAGLFVEIIGKPVDLLIWHRGWHLVDVKNPKRQNGVKDPRTKDQIALVERSPGPIHFCETTEDVLKSIGFTR